MASFAADSAALSEASKEYLDRLAPTLRPASGQLLLLEGHAADAALGFANDDTWLACERSRAVSAYLVESHGFVPERVEARAWLAEIDGDRALVELGGGCQGCGLAAMTLRQGIESSIKHHIPEIVEVVDVTDHAAGENPFFA